MEQYSNIHCKNCIVPLAKNRVIRKNNRGIIIHETMKIALEKDDQSNLARCKKCKDIVGNKINDKYIIFTGKFIIVRFELKRV